MSHAVTYDRAYTRLLIRETDNAGQLATHAEIALRNQLQLADDEIARLCSRESELWQTVEDVACGIKLTCTQCQQLMPCLCDK